MASQRQTDSVTVRGAAARNYVIIMPTRDEQRHLQQTIDCIAAQTVLPREVMIVDDGSSDLTGEIADAAANRLPWVRVVHRQDRGERKLGAGVIDAFYEGYRALVTRDYSYICKMDADVTLDRSYFQNVMAKMELNPKLGGASGKVFNPVDNVLHEERIIDEMVAGQVNFWRKECWEAIGGFVREVMWDGINFHRAHMFGWETRSFPDSNLQILHHRLMGSSHKNIYHGRLRWGRGQWFMGTHPLYIIASGIFRMRERPYIIGGLLIIAGYFRAWARGEKRYDDGEFRKHLHRWQLKRIRLQWMLPNK
jgi:glycosyltransferase involved in cell wall biosynthesis